MKKGKCTFPDAWDHMRVPSPYSIEIVLLQDLNPLLQAIRPEVPQKSHSTQGKETVASQRAMKTAFKLYKATPNSEMEGKELTGQNIKNLD